MHHFTHQTTVALLYGLCRDMPSNSRIELNHTCNTSLQSIMQFISENDVFLLPLKGELAVAGVEGFIFTEKEIICKYTF